MGIWGRASSNSLSHAPSLNFVELLAWIVDALLLGPQSLMVIAPQEHAGEAVEVKGKEPVLITPNCATVCPVRAAHHCVHSEKEWINT